MQKSISLKLLPSEAAETATVKQYTAQFLGIKAKNITGYNILKRSIDARGRQAWILLTIEAFIDEPPQPRKVITLDLKDVTRANRQVIVVGSGPAGLFAALRLIEAGVRPVVLERGRDVRSRRRDLALLNKAGIINPESNYCFGEGGAGTYSDGKLYTRSGKRGNVRRILDIFGQFGAEENIQFESHPHIGTNKLPQIITNIRNRIIECGGSFLFQQKVVDFSIQRNRVRKVICDSRDEFEGDAVILATGHSARDIFELLHQKGIAIESKPFALGVRIEHPQELIDSIQYHIKGSSRTLPEAHGENLPPASYSLVHQVDGRGVFSFCMCPGGIIAPASTSDGELVVNGWSPSKRNNRFANSGIVVSISEEDLLSYSKHGPLAGMFFQQSVEKKAFWGGGGKFAAPAQRMADFIEGKLSSSLPDCSYLPGLQACPLQEVLPPFVHQCLREGLSAFESKMRGYLTNDAVIVATESRTSSPVRIPRDTKTGSHPQVVNLYPCGEGAGYAGGIVSAAMDGELAAQRILDKMETPAAR